MDTHTCSHAACSCTLQLAQGFCSEECRRAAEGPGDVGGCTCSHPECRGEATEGRESEQDSVAQDVPA